MNPAIRREQYAVVVAAAAAAAVGLPFLWVCEFSASTCAPTSSR